MTQTRSSYKQFVIVVDSYAATSPLRSWTSIGSKNKDLFHICYVVMVTNIYKRMKLTKILQGSAVTQTHISWASYGIHSLVEIPCSTYLCQKLRKLVESRRSCYNDKQGVEFFWTTV